MTTSTNRSTSSRAATSGATSTRSTTNRRRSGRDPRTFLLGPCTGLVLVLSLGALTACGDDDNPADSTTTSSTGPASTAPSSSTAAPTSSTPGTGDSTAPASTGATDTTTAIANPASELCIHSGGTIEIVDEAGGQVAYCTLPDGTRFEEWDYFHMMNPTTTTTP